MQSLNSQGLPPGNTAMWPHYTIKIQTAIRLMNTLTTFVSSIFMRVGLFPITSYIIFSPKANELPIYGLSQLALLSFAKQNIL